MIEPNNNENVNQNNTTAAETTENAENNNSLSPDSSSDITEGKSLVDIFDEADQCADNEIKNELVGAVEQAYYDDELEERDYRPIRFSRSGRLGCLGGIMYATFILCLSVALACFAWMAACDVLALNKGDNKMSIVLSDEYFSEEEVDVFDDEGNKIGTETLLLADISAVSQLLRDNGIIEYPWLFKIFAQVSNADKKIDPGTYELSTRYDYRALVKNLQQTAGVKEIRQGITFPEGYTMAQIFNKLEAEGVCSAADLYDAAANYHYDFSFLDDSTLGDAQRLEGYIFPNTYDFYVGESASSVISKFLNTFHRQLYADMYQLCNNLGITFYDAVKIASMIEKEAANDEERAIIASVIFNRLYSGMTLGIDATILYEHPEHIGVQIPTEILQEDSPYNTHLRTGLPPTPICNPGLASLEAALHPASTSYYYYALDTETGTHRFFQNYNEFQNFINTQDYDNYTP